MFRKGEQIMFRTPSGVERGFVLDHQITPTALGGKITVATATMHDDYTIHRRINGDVRSITASEVCVQNIQGSILHPLDKEIVEELRRKNQLHYVAGDRVSGFGIDKTQIPFSGGYLTNVTKVTGTVQKSMPNTSSPGVTYDVLGDDGLTYQCLDRHVERHWEE